MYSMKIAGLVYTKGGFNILWASIGTEMLRVKYVGTDLPEMGEEVLADGKIVVDPQWGRQFVALGFRPPLPDKHRFGRHEGDERPTVRNAPG